MKQQHPRLRKIALAWLLAVVMLSTLLVVSLSPSAASGSAHNTSCIRFGNVDLDPAGKVDIDDILAVRGHMFGLTTLTGDALIAADVLETGVIDIDVILAIRGDMFGIALLGWSCESGVKYPTHPPVSAETATPVPEETLTTVPTATRTTTPTRTPSPLPATPTPAPTPTPEGQTYPPTRTPYPSLSPTSTPLSPPATIYPTRTPGPTRTPAPSPIATVRPDGTVVMRGTLLCMTADHPTTGVNEGGTHGLIFYATYGAGYINDTVNELLSDYPDGFVSAQDAQRFLDAAKLKLRFTLPENTTIGGCTCRDVDYGSATVTITGKVNPDTMTITNVTASANNGNVTDWAYQPLELKRPDAPKPEHVNNGGKPDLFLNCGTMRGEDGLRMKYIPAGDYLQGSWYIRGWRYQDEFPHRVVITRSFYMMEIPVTQGMFAAVGLTQPEKLAANGFTPPKGPNKFVSAIVMQDIKDFIHQLRYDNPDLDIRLPTDAEWEYAMRLGSSAPDYQDKYKSMQSTFSSTASTGTIKTKEPNGWGLYDMQISNAYHWVKSPKYDNVRIQEIDPHVKADSSTSKIKGGTHYTCWGPSMHGKGYASNGTTDEGAPMVFRLIVANADQVIADRDMS